MTQQAQAEALLIAAWLRKSNEEAMAWRLDAADAIERLHARVQELEAQKAVELPEPVAWLHSHSEHCIEGEVSGERLSITAKTYGWVETPLYTEQQVRAMVAAHAAPGWKLVPEMATQDMCESAKYGIDARLSVFKWADGYKAMLSSAPEFAALAATPAAAPVVLPEPDVALLNQGVELLHALSGDERNRGNCSAAEGAAASAHAVQRLGVALLAGVSAPAAQAVPDGWREKFAADVYADLAAADNQDVPLEEYPARILKVLDSIVGPRHPVVIKWRNDAIRNCIAIAYKYCRDPESHKYLKQDLEAMLTTEPAPQAQAVERGEVLVTVSGFTGSGKSAIAGEIEIMCRALGLQVEWPDSDSEKHMTHADWIAALEQYKPHVRIVECNVPHSVVKGQDK